jgi:glycosyltransferase involved in cell wall biosynthesis
MEKSTLVTIISNNNLEFIKSAILEIQNFGKLELLIIDDGSDYDILEEIKDFKFVKSIMHDESLGYGACLSTAIAFARDLGYNYLITLNPEESGFVKDIPNIINNLDYGYDIVTCSRILENSDYSKIDETVINFFDDLTGYLNKVTELDMTDPLSEIKGYNITSTQDIDLTVEDHAVLLQLFVQSSYFGYSIIEIPSESGSSFGKELDLYDNPLETFIAVIETEKYLYNKGSIN